MKTMRLDPNYPNVIRRMATGIANGDFEKGSEREVVATLIDLVRYQTLADESVLFEIMHELDPERAATMKEAHSAGRDQGSGGDGDS